MTGSTSRPKPRQRGVMMAKSRRLSKAAIQLLKDVDPREHADMLEDACFKAHLAGRTTVSIRWGAIDISGPIGDVWKLAKLLRLVPRLPHRSRLTTREWRNKEIVIDKALEIKRKLNEGMPTEDAEIYAANLAAKRAGAKALDLLLELRQPRGMPPAAKSSLIGWALEEKASLMKPRALKAAEYDAAALMAEFSDYAKSTILRGMRGRRE